MARPHKRITPKTISDLKPAPYNPRRISADALSGLKRSIDEFGDLSGIVFNSRTGHLVAGHQRLDALKANYGKALKLITKGGALKLTAGDREFPVRIVDWPESREKLANITANNPKIAGEYTDSLGDIVSQIMETDLSSLISPLNIDDLIPKLEPESPDTSSKLGNLEFKVIVDCRDEEQQGELIERLESEGLTCRALIS